jgi:beta-lactamase regulating signal transducer with metallopeptidase domain/protocatechuate 3,4-dioxygenase beta subunit
MTWSQTLVVSWLQFVVVAALLLAAARVAMRWIVQPAERIRLIQVALAGATAVPLVMVLAPSPAWRMGIIPTASRPESSSVEQSLQESAGDSMSGVQMPSPDIKGISPATSEVPTQDASAAGALAVAPQIPPAAVRLPALDGWLLVAIAIVLLHGISATFFLAEWIIGKVRLQQLVRSATNASPPVIEMWNAITGGHGDRVRLLVSTKITTPLTFGWWRPVVVLPRDIHAAGGQSLRYCLAHEWSHIERADILAWHWTWLCQFACWLQPLFWTLRRELRICQDILADGAATRGGKDAVEYSELLVGFARQGIDAPLAGALTFLDHPSQLMRRITMLLQRPIALRSRCTWSFSIAVGVAALIACSICTSVRLDAARAADKEQTTERQAKKAATEKSAKGEDNPANAKTQSEETPDHEKPAQLTYQCAVVDTETGQVVPNATVTVERRDSSEGPWPFKLIAKTTHVTDAEGKYTFEITPEQSGIRSLYIQIYAEHADYVRYSGGYSLSMIRKNETVGQRPFFKRLKLQPGDPITGKVIAPSGVPLAGAKLFGFTNMKPHDVNNTAWLDGQTAADGSFRLNKMKGGLAFIWVLPSDYAIVQRFVNQGDGDLGEIRLAEGIRLRGRTLNAEGKAVAGIVVNAYYQGKENEALQPYSVLTGIRRSAITDAEGRFTFDPLPAGEYRVVPEDESLDPRQERGVHPLPGVFVGQKIMLKEGASTELELQAVPHINLQAQYLDSHGKKINGSEFSVTGRLDGQFWSAKARPGKDGAVMLRLPHGIQDVNLGISTNEHTALRHRKAAGKPIENHNYNVQLGTLNDDVEGFEIISYKAPLVVVQAVDEAGQPIKSLEVVAHYAWMKSLTNYVATSTGSHVSMERQKDSRQRTSQLLPDEEVTFKITAKGYESATETLKLPEGETKDLVLTLKKTAETTQE